MTFRVRRNLQPAVAKQQAVLLRRADEARQGIVIPDGGLNQSQRISTRFRSADLLATTRRIGVRTHADDTFSHLLDDDRIDDAASPPRVICAVWRSPCYGGGRPFATRCDHRVNTVAPGYVASDQSPEAKNRPGSPTRTQVSTKHSVQCSLIAGGAAHRPEPARHRESEASIAD
jgi:hypothetical protein